MEALISFFKDFDMAALLPDIQKYADNLKFFVWVLMMVGPVLLLVLGALYHYKPTKEANYAWGFRTYFGMGSVEVWQFTQKLAGRIWMLLGGALCIIMILLGLFFGLMDGYQAAVVGIWCIVIELILVAGSWVWINMTTLKFFDKDGNRRKKPQR